MLERKVLNWMAYSFPSIGLSAMDMAYVAVDMPPVNAAHPYDTRDFNRCLNLVHEVPEIREHFTEIAKLSPEWMTIISNWDRLEKSFLNEAGLNFSKRSSAPITNQLLRDLRAKR